MGALIPLGLLVGLILLSKFIKWTFKVECPYCKQRIRHSATVCPFCRSKLVPVFGGFKKDD